jgi:hypothetical protein
MSAPTYVYGLVAAGTELPDGLEGLGPSGRVSTVAHGDVAAIVSDVPPDRPLGTRKDLLAHEAVVDAVAAMTAVLPMRFAAVVEQRGVVQELLSPHHDHFAEVLRAFEGRVQFTLKGRYEEEAVLREVVADDDDVRALRDEIAELPEDASYYKRVQLGELIVGVLEEKRDLDAESVFDRLEPLAVSVVANPPSQPDDVINSAFLVERESRQEFEDAVDEVGEVFAGRIRFTLHGPLAPYDFVPEEQ